MGIKTKPQNNKTGNRIQQSQGCISEQHPWFSFRYMTTNKQFNIESCNPGDLETTLKCLFSRLEELSKRPWVYWTQKPKANGLETMNYDELNFTANAEISLAKDTTIYLFRFDTYQGSGKGRIIGFKSSPCSVLHIIGFDIGFNAYKH